MSEQQSIGEENEDDVRSSTSNKERSDVWKYFEKYIKPDGSRMAICTGCNKALSANPNSGTSNLKRHLPKCFDLSVSGPERKRAPLDQAMYREKMAVAVIKHNYPFSYVEHEATRDLHKFLHRDANPISRNTAKADILKLYEKEKMILKTKLTKVTSRICLTADLWSSITTDGYMALTAHYVDENWVLRKKVLNFRFIPPPHSGSILADYVINFLVDWGIEKKVFTITLDNAKYNDGLVDTLGLHLSLNGGSVCEREFMHVRCGAHVLNLIVQAGLKVIDEAIRKVRDSVKYIRGSVARKFKFAECIQQLNLQCGRLVYQDFPTRWNSTYVMLDCALVYMQAYSRLELVDRYFLTCPSKEEWTRIQEITRFLKPFYEITTLFSGSLYPTSNLYFHKVWEIQCNIEKKINSPDPVIQKMAKFMKKKFDKYWENYCIVLSFGVILDPRYKVKIIEFCFSKLNLEETIREKKVKLIVDGFYKLYKEYEIQPEIIHDYSTTGSSNVGESDAREEDELDGFEAFPSQYQRVDTSDKSEVTKYLEEPEVNRKVKIDVLQYWKDNQGRYPRLAQMARDILSIPITTVASESSFSIGGQIISKYRSSLSSSNAEALLCTRDWLFDVQGEEEMEEELGEDIEALIPSITSMNF